MALLLSLIFAALSACAPWLVRRTKLRLLAAACVLGAVVSALTVVFSIELYPWSNVLVLLVGLSAGILLGRTMPKSAALFSMILLLLSALDIVQSILTGPGAPSTLPTGAPSPAHLAGNLLLLLPSGRFNLGIFDIIIIAMMSEHGRRRGATFLFTLLPGVLGIALAFAFLRFVYQGPLPLIPFLTAGWLCVLALAKLRRQPSL